VCVCVCVCVCLCVCVCVCTHTHTHTSTHTHTHMEQIAPGNVKDLLASLGWDDTITFHVNRAMCPTNEVARFVFCFICCTGSFPGDRNHGFLPSQRVSKHWGAVGRTVGSSWEQLGAGGTVLTQAACF